MIRSSQMFIRTGWRASFSPTHFHIRVETPHRNCPLQKPPSSNIGWRTPELGSFHQVWSETPHRTWADRVDSSAARPHHSSAASSLIVFRPKPLRAPTHFQIVMETPHRTWAKKDKEILQPRCQSMKTLPQQHIQASATKLKVSRYKSRREEISLSRS